LPQTTALSIVIASRVSPAPVINNSLANPETNGSFTIHHPTTAEFLLFPQYSCEKGFFILHFVVSAFKVGIADSKVVACSPLLLL
jgi:hypothetical protein